MLLQNKLAKKEKRHRVLLETFRHLLNRINYLVVDADITFSFDFLKNRFNCFYKYS